MRDPLRLDTTELPSLRGKPCFQELHSCLESLQRPLTDFLSPPKDYVDPLALRWTTSLITNDLAWLDEDERATIIELASTVLASNCGRNAYPSSTRTFKIPDADGGNTFTEFIIHEPSLVNDSLGLKTWSTSYLVAQKLATILPEEVYGCRAIELGSGTGLLGLAAQCLFSLKMTLTDYLPEVIDNLQKNVSANHCKSEVATLDWSDLSSSPIVQHDQTFDLILMCDFMYSSDQPSLVINALTTISHVNSLILAAWPERHGNEDIVTSYHELVSKLPIETISSGSVQGYEDFNQQAVTSRWTLSRMTS